ncbi:hypothetical protein D9758_009922 [Tetrapyrgos nigripes]|uniref:Transmembrane protein n=1 Tax=Tetrapyrgos nigripes TaxID=182062 RepID=A0A8H5CQV5_9AGAR|nr:hypothetical protein D9758_009922 [Tetrapyrgos nigripes]
MTTGLAFPSVGLQTLVCLVYFFGITIISHCVSRRIPRDNYRHTPWIRWLILSVFVDSWLFLFISGLLIFGIGMETSSSVCMTGIFLCIVFYASTKVLLYVYLIEKVRVVWARHNTPRLQSPIYMIGLLTIILYGGVGITLVIGRIHYLNPSDGFCYIGLKFYASLTLLSYDLYITLFLTGLFLWPLLHGKFMNPRIYGVARRTLVSAMVALTMSTANLAVLTAWHGKERGWMCLVCCTTDIIFNALALFWVTREDHEDVVTTASVNAANTSNGRNPPRGLSISDGHTQVMMKALKADAKEDDHEAPTTGFRNPFRSVPPVQVMVTTVREGDDYAYETEDAESVKRPENV